jgi:hypothetical protein
MTQELLRILALLAYSGIAAMPYKGPALAASVYGDISLREFADLDILLRPQDIAQAKALLLEQGYLPEYPLQPAVEAALLRSRTHYHLALVHGTSAIMAELHWMTDLDFPVEALAVVPWWARAARVDLEEGKVRCLEVRELLLILCLHGSKHHWSSMGWLVDVAELIREHSGLDWTWVMGQARELACERRLALGLDLAHRLLGAPLPQEVLGRIAAVPRVHELSAQVVRRLFEATPARTSALRNLVLDLRLYDLARQRLGHLLNVVFAPSLVEWSRWPVPRGLLFLHYPLRLFRLIGKYWLLPFDKRARR